MSEVSSTTERAPQTGFDGEFPFNKPEGSDASMFIQWKGTEVCLDFVCSCGADGHFDGFFAHFLRCPTCGAVYRMGTQVIAKRVAEPDDDMPIQTLDVEDPPAVEQRD